MKKLHKAFTLAEILLVFGILGIVAVMTIPNFILKIETKQDRIALRKFYSAFSQATQSISLDNQGSLQGICADDDQNCVKELYKKKLAYSKECNQGSFMGNCWASSWKYLNDTTDVDNNGWDFDLLGHAAGLQLKDGTYVSFEYSQTNCPIDFSQNINKTGCFITSVDVNGPKKPNKMGYDIFRFYVLTNRAVPMGLKDQTNVITNYPCKKTSRGDGCTAPILNDIDFVIPAS